MHTNVPGVYAAGDVRVKSLRQVAMTAVADGCDPRQCRWREVYQSIRNIRQK